MAAVSTNHCLRLTWLRLWFEPSRRKNWNLFVSFFWKQPSNDRVRRSCLFDMFGMKQNPSNRPLVPRRLVSLQARLTRMESNRIYELNDWIQQKQEAAAALSWKMLLTRCYPHKVLMKVSWLVWLSSISSTKLESPGISFGLLTEPFTTSFHSFHQPHHLGGRRRRRRRSRRSRRKSQSTSLTKRGCSIGIIDVIL
jgi:hypothetical protein